jgi:hypothetical protein
MDAQICTLSHKASSMAYERMNKSDTSTVIFHRITRFYGCVCVYFCSRLEMIGSLAAGATPGGITNDQTRLLNGDLRPHKRPQSTLGSPSSWLFWQAIYQPERISRTGFRRRAVRANANEISTTMLCVRSAANSARDCWTNTRAGKFLGTRRAEK